MHVDPKDTLAGQPILKIRKFLRQHQSFYWSDKTVIADLGVDSKTARRIIDALKEDGYIKESKLPGRIAWENTIKGNALALASAAKPISRTTAERKLKEFMDRVIMVRDSKYFLYKVTKVIVFGSYLSKKEKINDIDLSISLEPKERDVNKQTRLNEERINGAIEIGRKFQNEGERIFWPEIEVIKFLKSRSRSLRIHNEEPILARTKYKVIYKDK